MIDNPMTPPGADQPAGQQPIYPPVLTMVPVTQSVADASQEIIDHVYACIQAAVGTVDATEQELRAAIQACLTNAEATYQDSADEVSTNVLARLGVIAAQLGDYETAPLTEAELRQRVASIPWKGGPLPPRPDMPLPFYAVPAPKVRSVVLPDMPLGLPHSAPIPAQLQPYSVPSRPAGSPISAATPSSSAAPGGPYVPHGTTPTPAAPPPSRPLQPPAPKAGYPSNRDAPPVGGGTKPPALVTTGGRQPASQEDSAPVATGAGAGAPPAVVCPPVNVVIHCAPGTTATVGDQGEQHDQGGEDQRGGGSEGGDRYDIGSPKYTNDQWAWANKWLDKRHWVPHEDPTFLALDDADRKLLLEMLAERDRAREEYARKKGRNPKILPYPEGKFPAAAEQPAAPSPDLIEWWQHARKIFERVVTPEGCRDVQSIGGDVDRVVNAVLGWVTGDPKGRSWNPKEGLPKAIGELPTAVQYVAEPLGRLFGFVVSTLSRNVELLTGCESKAAIPPLLARAIVGAAEGWLQTPLPEAHNRLSQVMGQLCPSVIPSPEEADLARRVGLIDKATWSCWVRANGVRDDLHETVWKATAPRPAPADMVEYWMRAGADPESLDGWLRWAGVNERLTKDVLVENAKFLPGASDLVTFMTRDVFDEQVVQKYQFDEAFEQKFSGKALEWAKAQGVEPEVFRYYWRAHWQLPSPTQSYEMVHRLRPGVVAPELVTTEKDINQLLEINDYPAFWRERLVAISYRPLTRVDVRRSYFIGALSDDEVLSAAQDIGYSEANARRLLKFWQFDRVEWALNRPFARAYVRGELSDAELLAEMELLHLSPNQQDLMEQKLELASKQITRKRTLAAIRRRVVGGLTDWPDAQQELIALGYRPARASAIAQSWEEEKGARGKFPAAGQLCKMYGNGIISAGDYTTGLLRLGYSAEDVRHIAQLCGTVKGGKDPFAGDEVGELAAQAGAKEKAATLRQQRQAKAAVARAARQRLQLSKAEESVQKRLTQTMVALSKAFGSSPSTYQKDVNALFAELNGEKCYTRLGAADLVKEVVVDLARRSRKDWLSIAEDFVGKIEPRPCPAADTGTSDSKKAMEEESDEEGP